MSLSPQRSHLAGGVNRSYATFRAISALVLREMATRYGRSPGGYIWALLEPLGGVIILSVGLAVIVRSPPLGTSFILFFATGFLPFNLYQTLSGTIARSIDFSRALLFYPAVTWVDAVMARFLINALTSILVMLFLMTGILAVLDVNVLIDFHPILIATVLAMLFGAGVGVLNCALFGLYPVWMQVWSIITRPLFIVSGVFFLYEDMPQIAKNILWYNPLMHVTGFMRAGFYPTYTAAYANAAFVVAISLICLFLGVVLLGRYHRDILHQ